MLPEAPSVLCNRTRALCEVDLHPLCMCDMLVRLAIARACWLTGQCVRNALLSTAAWAGLAEAVQHCQEFVELVRQERMLEAIAYSRQHLSPWSDLYQAELQRALAALAFRAGEPCHVTCRLRFQAILQTYGTYLLSGRDHLYWVLFRKVQGRCSREWCSRPLGFHRRSAARE